MILQGDILELRNWVFGALHPNAHAGDFVRSFAEACSRADSDNYMLLRSVLIEMARKYPRYKEFDAVDNRHEDSGPATVE